MPHPKADDVCQHARARLPQTLERLTGYLRYPAISCDPDHFGDVRRLAATIRDDLDGLGFQNARVLELDDALPCVAAEKMDAGPDRPCVLIYGHLDLQPVKGEPWNTPPHEAVEKNGRLYARGSGDDMGGWVSHLAAIESWLAVAGVIASVIGAFYYLRIVFFMYFGDEGEGVQTPMAPAAWAALMGSAAIMVLGAINLLGIEGAAAAAAAALVN